MKNVRMLIVGMVAGAILATSATAFAGPVSSKISALLRPDISVTINGKQIKNAPINYNGTTYLPLRETSDAFGGKLDLQGKSITITQPKEVTQVPETQPDNVSNVPADLTDLVEVRPLLSNNTLSGSDGLVPGEGNKDKRIFKLNGKNQSVTFVVPSVILGPFTVNDEFGNQLVYKEGSYYISKELLSKLVN